MKRRFIVILCTFLGLSFSLYSQLSIRRQLARPKAADTTNEVYRIYSEELFKRYGLERFQYENIECTGR